MKNIFFILKHLILSIHLLQIKLVLFMGHLPLKLMFTFINEINFLKRAKMNLIISYYIAKLYFIWWSALKRKIILTFSELSLSFLP